MGPFLGFKVVLIEINANAFKNNSGPVRAEPLDILLSLRSIVEGERYTTAWRLPPGCEQIGKAHASSDRARTPILSTAAFSNNYR